MVWRASGGNIMDECMIEVGGIFVTDEEFARMSWPRQWWQDWTPEKDEEYAEE